MSRERPPGVHHHRVQAALKRVHAAHAALLAAQVPAEQAPPVAPVPTLEQAIDEQIAALSE